MLKAGSSGQSEAVTFTPSDSTDYTTASSTVTVNVGQATPTVASVDREHHLWHGLGQFALSGTATGR